MIGTENSEGVSIKAIHRGGSGHCDQNSFLGGTISYLSFDDFIEKFNGCSSAHCRFDATSDFVRQYKIHLMPRDEDLILVLKKLMTITATDNNFRDSLYQIKIKTYPNQLLLIISQLFFGRQNQLPKIVLYAIGKSNAQYLLDTIFKHFKDTHGSGLQPAFNKKITDFIYFAQGDRNEKIDHPEFFKKSFHPALDKIYFDAQYLNTLISDQNKRFSQQDFELIDPGH